MTVVNHFDLTHTIPIRGILAILVVCGHLDSVVRSDISVFKYVHFSTPAVAVFFFMSGYGLMRSIKKKGSSYLSGFYGKSFIKLIIPLVTLSFIYQLILVIQGSFSWSVILSDFITGTEMPLIHSWYVLSLFFFYTCFYVCFKWIKQIGKAMCVLVALVVLYYFIVKYAFGWPFFWWRTALSFAIGVVYSFYESRIVNLVKGKKMSLGIAFVIMLLLAVAYLLIPTFIPIVPELFYTVLGPGLAIGLYYVEMPTKIKALNFLGMISFEIYLIHGIFEKLLYPQFGNTYLYIGGVFVCTIVLSYVFHLVFNKINCMVLKK